MCRPEAQAEREMWLAAARAALTRKHMLTAQLKRAKQRGASQTKAQGVQLGAGTKATIHAKRKAAEEILDQKHTRAMLRATIVDRETEGEVLFAIEEMIGNPETWKKYLSDIFWSNHWDNGELMKIVSFLAYNGLPFQLARQWVAVRGVVYEQRKLGIHWENTVQGKWKRGAFTWDLIAKDYCLLDTGEPTTIPESKRSKQSPD